MKGPKALKGKPSCQHEIIPHNGLENLTIACLFQYFLKLGDLASRDFW